MPRTGLSGWSRAKAAATSRSAASAVREENAVANNDVKSGTTLCMSVSESLADGTTRRILNCHLHASGDGGPNIADSGSTSVQVVLERTPQTEHWFDLKGARKLLCQQALVEVVVDGEGQSASLAKFTASSLVLVGALPSAPYIVRLLCMPTLALQKLLIHSLSGNSDSSEEEMGAEANASTLVALAAVLRPCTLAQCTHLRQRCLDARIEKKSHLLFKNKEVLDVVASMRQVQGWTRRLRAPPATNIQTWKALLRLEACWGAEEAKHGRTDDCDKDDNTFLDIKGHENGEHTHTSIIEEEEQEGEEIEANLTTAFYSAQALAMIRGLPNPEDERRKKYILSKKMPQVKWMIALMRRLLAKRISVKREPITICDVGGGRGDLAIAAAAAFAEEKPAVRVVVLDINQTSLEVGRRRAAKAGLASKMTFLNCDCADLAALRRATPSVDLVFGLHCCGGLAEAATAFAIRRQASFCICTCCFCSIPSLATLSKSADALSGSRLPYSRTGDDHASDRLRVSKLAVCNGWQGQHRAIRALNAMRLFAAVHEYESTFGTKTGISVWQERYAAEFSNQNRVLVGSLYPATSQKSVAFGLLSLSIFTAFIASAIYLYST